MADDLAEAQERAKEAVASFAAELAQLKVECGDPSLRQLESQNRGKPGMSYSNLSEIFGGKRLPKLDAAMLLVRSMVAAAEGGGGTALTAEQVRHWKQRWMDTKALEKKAESLGKQARASAKRSADEMAKKATEQAAAVLRLARTEADEIRAAAQRSAAAVLEEARRRAEEGAADRVEAVVAQAHRDAERVVAQAKEESERILGEAQQRARESDHQEATDLRIVLDKLLLDDAEDVRGALKSLGSAVGGVRATVVRHLHRGAVARLVIGELPVEIYIPDNEVVGLHYSLLPSVGEQVWLRPVKDAPFGFAPVLVLEQLPPAAEPEDQQEPELRQYPTDSYGYDGYGYGSYGYADLGQMPQYGDGTDLAESR